MPSWNTSEKLNMAHDICLSAHAGQVDKAGKPYHLHPEFVADHVEGEDAKIVALLHDLLEDTTYPLDSLRAAFSENIVVALLLLKHEEGTPYMDYVRSLKGNHLARAVKIADLQHNSMLERLPSPEEKDLARVEKYKEALRILME